MVVTTEKGKKIIIKHIQAKPDSCILAIFKEPGGNSKFVSRKYFHKSLKKRFFNMHRNVKIILCSPIS